MILETAQNPSNIYNVCIIAHVDHGKTSLTDCLISSNNIISKKLQGKMLYMDFREDEQERLITMKSSSISLVTPLKAFPDSHWRLVNIIDSPGHMDFEFEVVGGLRISDGAILVVDVVEGVSSQTFQLLKRAIEADLEIVLFLNKIDKLFSLFNLNPERVFEKLLHII